MSPTEVAAAMWANDHASKSLGMQLVEVGSGTARLTMIVRPDMVNGLGVCHGGFIFTLADSAMAFASNSANVAAVAAGAQIDFVAPAHEGEMLVAVATQRWLGGRNAVNDIEVRTVADERLIALVRGRTVRVGRPIIEDTAGNDSEEQS